MVGKLFDQTTSRSRSTWSQTGEQAGLHGVCGGRAAAYHDADGTVLGLSIRSGSSAAGASHLQRCAFCSVTAPARSQRQPSACGTLVRAGGHERPFDLVDHVYFRTAFAVLPLAELQYSEDGVLSRADVSARVVRICCAQRDGIGRSGREPATQTA
jgi:hypothetical protein